MTSKTSASGLLEPPTQSAVRHLQKAKKADSCFHQRSRHSRCRVGMEVSELT